MFWHTTIHHNGFDNYVRLQMKTTIYTHTYTYVCIIVTDGDKVARTLFITATKPACKQTSEETNTFQLTNSDQQHTQLMTSSVRLGRLWDDVEVKLSCNRQQQC